MSFQAKWIGLPFVTCVSWTDGTAVSGGVRVANVVLVGAVSRLPRLPEDVWWKCLTERIPPKHLDLNRCAFMSGRATVA